MNISFFKKGIQTVKKIFKTQKDYFVNTTNDIEIIGYTLNNQPIFKSNLIISKNPKKYSVDTVSAAHYLGVSETTLRRWRKKDNKGPTFFMVPEFKVMYKIKDLETFKKTKEN